MERWWGGWVRCVGGTWCIDRDAGCDDVVLRGPACGALKAMWQREKYDAGLLVRSCEEVLRFEMRIEMEI